MKKKVLKKKVRILLLLILIIGIMVTFLLNQNSKNNQSKEEKKQKETKEEIKETKKEMSLIAVGDILIHDMVYKDAKTNNGYDFNKMFTMIKPIVEKYDLKYMNQESPIAGSEYALSGYPAFNSPREIGDNLVDDVGFNMVSLSNNHLFDKGYKGALNSINYWKTKNVKVAGSSSSVEERNNIPIYEQNGIKYAFLAYTTFSNNPIPSEYSYLINVYSDEQAKKDIESVRDKVDVIIVSMHWGIEDLTNKPQQSQVDIANYLSSLGVNLILGSHAHTIQPVEYIGNTLVVYGLGNFISNQLYLNMNNAIGLMIGMDIVVDEGKVTFKNMYKELVLAYSEDCHNFKVIPVSKLTDENLRTCGSKCSGYTVASIKEKFLPIVGA